MRIRTRLALVLALSLVVAGSLTLVVTAMAFDRTDYQTWDSYRDSLMAELGVSRASAITFIRAHPEVIFDAPGDTGGLTNTTIDQASRAVQRRAVDAAVARSRRWTVLGFIAVLSGALTAGWLLAGRMLRPIRLMTRQARTATAQNLGRGLSLAGPNDELKELADTFDGMLDRLEQAFTAQRRFSGQVAHELRNPLAITHTEVEMLLADTDETTVRTRLETIADATVRSERIVSQLLVLSRTDLRDLDQSSFAFDELVGNVVGRAVEGPKWSRLRVDLELRSTSAVGDRALLETLARNLVDNAGRHNHPDGWVRIAVGPSPDARHAVLDVANSVADDGDPSRDDAPGVPHIGLSIVAAVVDAHGGTIEWRRAPGSISAHVELPVAPDTAAPELVGAGATP